MSTEWRPANQVEADMAAALAEGDGRRYAEIVFESPLFLPKLPERNSERYWELVRRIPVDTANVLAFTSLEAMSLVLGPFAQGHTPATFESLVRLLPNPELPLTLNPGLPIGVIAPPGMLIAVSRGETSLTPLAEVRRDIEDVADAYVRQLCLEALGAHDQQPYEGKPVNELETALAGAVAAQDGDAFLDALLEGEVIIPLTRPLDRADELDESNAVWFRTEGELPVVPVFSSAPVLDYSSSGQWDRAQVPFLTLLANWPDEQHVLCFNPGTETELVVFGDALFSLLADLAESAQEMGLINSAPDDATSS